MKNELAIEYQSAGVLRTSGSFQISVEHRLRDRNQPLALKRATKAIRWLGPTSTD